MTFRNYDFVDHSELLAISFFETDMVNYSGLTTNRQHLDGSGQISIELLMTALKNLTHLPRHIEFPLQGIQREPCKDY